MTKPWKLKTNSSNILLVLITLILIKTEWTRGESNDLLADRNGPGVMALVGNDQIARYYFRSNRSTPVIARVSRCLENFQIMTCLKLMLLDRINEAVEVLDRPEIAQRDLVFLNGLIAFDRKADKKTGNADLEDEGDVSSLDGEISSGMMKLFRNRSLRLNLSSDYKLEIEPVDRKEKNDEFLCFRYKINRGTQEVDNTLEQQRGRKRGGMNMMMMMPQLIMMGLLPFTLATIKAFVMNAMMVNMMALNGAIFMTIRNFVFGPRSGGNVQYVNYGYSKDRQTQKKRPVLIIHSPAAFVKQPVYHYKYQEKPHHHHYVSRESDYQEDDASLVSEETWRDSVETGDHQDSSSFEFQRRRQSYPDTRRVSTDGNPTFYLVKKFSPGSTYQRKPKTVDL
ncbi:hypothetical protein RUM43_011907 [Polyplax serrata]|uniref:Uncharacterized protein n=1 Tax=Polyplax serrata TaxID=468196 RepID=A0AAN8NYY1_POLSC